MAITLVGSGSAQGSGTVAVSFPPATSGDLLLAFVAVQGNGANEYPRTPSGWTMATGNAAGAGSIDQGIQGHYAFWKIASGGETSQSFATGGFTYRTDAAVLIYRGVSPSSPIAQAAQQSNATSTTYTAPSITGIGQARLVAGFALNPQGSTSGYSVTSPLTKREQQIQNYLGLVVGDETTPPIGATGTRTATGPSAYSVGITVLLRSGNNPPLAPTWVTPQNTIIPTDADFDLDWEPNDPDPGDSQSEYVLDRWTLDGPGGARIAGSNVRVSVATPNSYRRITAGSLAVGAYEYKVATRDSQGAPTDPAQLVFSESLFVTAAESPDPPSFVAPGPIAGETISTSEREYVISAPDVDASEWTLYADNNGTIDTTTVLAGPVLKETGDLRRHTFTGLANNTAVWAQVEIKDGGLWSQPTQQRNPVAYSPPPAPTYTLLEDPDEGEIVVQINNPAPGTGEVATSYNDVFITDPGKPEQRRATEIPANGAWTYQLPPSGFDGVTTGVVRVEAVADNGTRTSSA